MIDVTKVEVNEKAKEVLITGVDLDSIWCFKDEPDETAECNEVSYKFDISLAISVLLMSSVSLLNSLVNLFISSFTL